MSNSDRHVADLGSFPFLIDPVDNPTAATTSSAVLDITAWADLGVPALPVSLAHPQSPTLVPSLQGSMASGPMMTLLNLASLPEALNPFHIDPRHPRFATVDPAPFAMSVPSPSFYQPYSRARHYNSAQLPARRGSLPPAAHLLSTSPAAPLHTSHPTFASSPALSFSSLAPSSVSPPTGILMAAHPTPSPPVTDTSEDVASSWASQTPSLNIPCSRRATCRPCNATVAAVISHPSPSPAGLRGGRRPRTRSSIGAFPGATPELDVTCTACEPDAASVKMSAKVVCDACKAVAGYSADKAVAEQAVEKSPEHEFVCWRCVEVFDFCVECEGAGTYRSGQWRPRPLFVSGPHRPCALRHATSGENHKKLQIITTRCNPSTSSPSHALSGFNLTSAAAPPPNLARPLRDVLHLYDEMLWSTISPRVVRASPWLADWSQWEQRRAAGHLELTRFIVGPSDPGAGDVRTFLAVGYRVRPQPRAGRGSGAQRQQSMSSVASSSSSTSVSVSPKRRRGRKDDTIASGVGGGLVGGLQDTVPAAAAFLSWHASAGHVQLGTVGILGRGSGVEERVLYHRLNSALFKKIEEEIDEEQQRAVGEGAIATVAVPDHVWLYVGGGGTALAVQMGFQPIAVYCARFGLGVAELQSRFRIDVSGGGVADAGPAKELYIMRWQERPWGSGDF